MRDSYLQLPKQDEIKAILQAEADREIPEAKKDKSYVDFSPLYELMTAYNVPLKALQEQYSAFEMYDKGIVDTVTETFNDLCKSILTSEPTDKQREKLKDLYNYLSEEDRPRESDIIFVFGSKAKFRTNKAISLYKSGFAPKVMFSGDKAFYEKEDKTAEIYNHVEHAKESGIPEDDIILEDNSITVPDNVKRSLNLLERKDIKHNKIILVMSPFAQRRGYAHFCKFSNNVEFFRVNSKSSEKYNPDKWHKNEVATKVVINEWAKMRFAQTLNTI